MSSGTLHTALHCTRTVTKPSCLHGRHVAVMARYPCAWPGTLTSAHRGKRVGVGGVLQRDHCQHQPLDLRQCRVRGVGEWAARRAIVRQDLSVRPSGDALCQWRRPAQLHTSVTKLHHSDTLS